MTLTAPRWLQDPSQNTSELAPIHIRSNALSEYPAFNLDPQSPFKVQLIERSSTPPSATTTLPPQLVFHEVQSIIQNASKHLQTEQDIEGFCQRFQVIRCESLAGKFSTNSTLIHSNSATHMRKKIRKSARLPIQSPSIPKGVLDQSGSRIVPLRDVLADQNVGS